MGDARHGRRAGTRAGVAQFGRVVVIRLGPDEDLLPAMEHLMLDVGIQQGVILSGVASLHRATVRNIHRFPEDWPITAADRRVTAIAGPLEVLAMQGNVAPNDHGGLVIHCHLDFSTGAPPGVTFGGHLVEGTIVATTCELYVAELVGLDVRRVLDDHTRTEEIMFGPAPS